MKKRIKISKFVLIISLNMSKSFSFLLFLLIPFCIFAQMDTEHWFAPYARSSSANVEYPEQYFYLSTDSTTPFEVKIYNNNTLYKTVYISKGNPGIVSVETYLMEDSAVSEKSKINKKGFYLVGERKFFAHYRFYVENQAEIITSKGKAGLGTEFFAFTPENAAGPRHANSTVGIIATENNTSITFDNFQQTGTLTNGESFNTSTTKTITLNRGESYTLETTGTDALKGLSGMKITSTQPISVTSGSYLNISLNGSNVDIFMDQALPTNRLGKQYISMKGNGGLAQGMERLAIMATEDNTTLFVNGSSTPIIIAKKGETYILNSSFYSKATTTADVYTIFLQADKNVYAYQLLTGVDNGGGNFSFASGGMNILPPLLCLLPNVIDEFANINEIGRHTFNTRLNIITEKGAEVKLNGTNLTSTPYGPFPVEGNQEWEVYMYPNISGNVTIESTKAVTAGIAAGNNAVGYGGYFAGFSSNPVIAKGGNCQTGNTLEVDDSYDDYQWYKNGTEYTGTGANTYKITPDGPGVYYVKIKKSSTSCADEYTSPEFIVENCPIYTEKTINIGECGTSFQAELLASSQPINPISLKIENQPTHGRIIIDNTTGKITYIPDSGTANSDTFTYYIEGISSTYPEKELVTVYINIHRIDYQNTELISCLNSENLGTYNLKNANVTQAQNVEIQYFETTSDAENNSNPILNPEQFISVPKTVYAKITDEFSCSFIAKIKLNAYPEIQISHIDISGSTVTINATGGNGTLLYSIDNVHWQNSPIFQNVNRGTYNAIVKDDCEKLYTKPFILLNLLNVITPNGDGKNDILDYSDLKIKQNVDLKIFDRYGKIIFQTQNEPYTWNGTIAGRPVSTGTYWYILQWIEPDTGETKSYSSWLLVKNR